MTSHAVLFLDDEPWRLAVCGQDTPKVTRLASRTDADVDQRVTEALEALRQHGCAHTPIMLAVPSTWCAAACVQTADLPRKDRSTAMAYRLEERLPIAAEQFAAGFILDGGSALGVCVTLDKIGPLVHAIESKGTCIHAIIPTAMLLAQQLVAEKPHAQADALIWRHEGWLDTILLAHAGQKAVAWSLLPDEPDAIGLYLNTLAIHGRVVRNVLLVDEVACASDQPHRDASGIRENTTIVSEDPYRLATRGALKLLTGQRSPWVDLMGAGLGSRSGLDRIRKPVKAAVAAAVLMLVCLNAAFLWRAHQYNRLADNYRESERRLYFDLYPGHPPPLVIHNRLEGEYRKISGMRGRSGSLPTPPATLTLLYRVLEQFPDGVRFRVMELRIEDDSVTIEGQARSHGDVGLIANALSAGDTLRVETRHTEQLAGEKGVGFVIVALPRSPPPKVTMK